MTKKKYCDKIVNVIFTNEERLGLLTHEGNFLLIETSDIRAIGRVTRGIKGIKLNEGDYVVAAKVISNNATMLTSISKNGLFKKTPLSDFFTQGKNTKGSKLQRLNDNDFMADFAPIINEKEVLVASSKACIKVSVDEVPQLSKGAAGNKSIKLSTNDYIISISQF